MTTDDEDFPLSYLVYTIAVIAAMGGLAVAAFFVLFR